MLELPDLKDKILSAVHCATYAAHSGGTKMCKDLKQTFWWLKLTGDVTRLVARCLVCHQIKAEHQRPAEKLQPLPVPEWKWENHEEREANWERK